MLVELAPNDAGAAAKRTKERCLRTLLVSMPWASIRRPNLGLATLSAQLIAAGFECEVFYPCMKFAAAIGEEAYETLADSPGLFAACEHVFALTLFDEGA
ncbi:MAG TPA: hypothetical protein VHA14_21085, partial [Bryobacteraceae bacterium]|nr:hypothetical protein [Bryobacteraceae bacterium]